MKKQFNNQFATQKLRGSLKKDEDIEETSTTSGAGAYPTIARKKNPGAKPIAAGKAKNYVKDHWGWKEAPSIPNRKSKAITYTKVYEGEELKENYSRFKKETKTRTNEQQLHAAMRLAEKKIHEANRILEYTSQLRGELNETRMNKNTQKLMEKITRGIAEAYGKMKKMK